MKNFGFIRFAGSGLCNSLYVYARAALLAHEHNLKLITPAWLSFDPAQWKQWNRDKRTYIGLFKNLDVSGVKKLWLLTSGKIVREENLTDWENSHAEVVEVFHMRGFGPIMGHSEFVKDFLLKAVNPKHLKSVDAFDFTDKIAVHVRLGDYGSSSLPISYYKGIVEQVHAAKPSHRFLLFSDGRESELKELLDLPYVERAFFGSSISDIFAISRCRALIGSYSTFSDWGGTWDRCRA